MRSSRRRTLSSDVSPADEYERTVRDVLGVDVSEDADELLPPQLRTQGFSKHRGQPDSHV